MISISKKREKLLHVDQIVAACKCVEKPPWGGRGALPYKRLMGTCRWMGSHFHDWIDYHGVAFSRVTRMGSHIF